MSHFRILSTRFSSALPAPTSMLPIRRLDFRITHLRLKPAIQRLAIVVPNFAFEFCQLPLYPKLLGVSFVHVTRPFRAKENYPRWINRRAQWPAKNAVVKLAPIQRDI